MVLIDSSVWVEHLRGVEPTVVRLLESARVLVHPFVIGELALGGLRQSLALGLLRDLPQATVADAEEVLASFSVTPWPGRASAMSTPICWRRYF